MREQWDLRAAAERAQERAEACQERPRALDPQSRPAQRRAEQLTVEALQVAAHTIRLRLDGELDIASCEQVRRALETLHAHREEVQLDLGELRFIDCSGLHVLLDAARRAERDDGALRVVSASACVTRLLGLTGTTEQLAVA